MSRIRLGLVLTVLGCAEPTATYVRPATSATLEAQQNNWYSFSPVDRTVYVRLTSVRTESGEPIRVFMRRMFESADSAGAQRLVIDLRPIAGMDARLLVPLVRGVVMRDRFVQRGGLFVVVGPDSFLPMQNTAKLLQQYANPIFVR